MSHHRITVCQHCGKDTEDTERNNSRWERGCDVCGKRLPEKWADSGCIGGQTINQIQVTTGYGTRVTIDACGDCIGNGGAMRKLIMLVAATTEKR